MYHDHHMHPLGYASAVNGLDLMGAADIEAVLTMIAAHATRVEGAVIGQRLDDESLAEGRLPTRHDLDGAVPRRPTLVYRYCGHIAVANGAALDLVGIDAETPDPPGGSIDRDRTGAPTGVLRETAVTLVGNALAPLARPPSDGEILSALSSLREMGIGSVTGMAASSEPLWCGVGDELSTLCRLAADLPVDIDLFVITEDPADLAAAAERIRRTEGRVRFSGWKGFADGSLGGHTAALHEPFTDDPGNRGTVRLDPAQASVMARASFDLGGAAAIHAIGDRANDLVLDVFESLAFAGHEPSSMRVEHASLLTPQAVERMGRLGVTASVQPAFLASEHGWLEKRLGDRVERVYPFRSLLEAGVPLVGGSDSPVEMPDPLVGIEAAVGRHGVDPEQALSREQAEALFAPPAITVSAL